MIEKNYLHIEVIAFLIDLSCDVNGPCGPDKSPLIFSVIQHGNVACLRLLLDASVNLNVRDGRKRTHHTPLMAAINRSPTHDQGMVDELIMSSCRESINA